MVLGPFAVFFSPGSPRCLERVKNQQILLYFIFPFKPTPADTFSHYLFGYVI